MSEIALYEPDSELKKAIDDYLILKQGIDRLGLGEIPELKTEYVSRNEASMPPKDKAEKMLDTDKMAELLLKDKLSREQKIRFVNIIRKKEKLLEEREEMKKLLYNSTRNTSLTKEKWNFLWNLANWKYTTILSSRLEKYTFWVMIFTIIVVIFTIISVGIQLDKFF